LRDSDKTSWPIQWLLPLSVEVLRASSSDALRMTGLRQFYTFEAIAHV
jgi:hypothetical protein